MASLPLSDMPYWPAALTWDEAQAYARVNEAQLREWNREGKVRFWPRGPHGARICLRSALDAALNDALSGDGGDFELE